MDTIILATTFAIIENVLKNNIDNPVSAELELGLYPILIFKILPLIIYTPIFSILFL